MLDRLSLRLMDRVVRVSDGQATKVRRAAMPDGRAVVTRGAIGADRFGHPDPSALAEAESLFAVAPARIVGAGGRLSPEKGFAVLVEAARAALRDDPGAASLSSAGDLSAMRWPRAAGALASPRDHQDPPGRGRTPVRNDIISIIGRS